MIGFDGKKGLVLGVANQRSIALAVARQLDALGAELCLTYGPDPKGRFEAHVRGFADQMNVTQIHPLDVREDGDVVRYRIRPEIAFFLAPEDALYFRLRPDFDKSREITTTRYWTELVLQF